MENITVVTVTLNTLVKYREERAGVAQTYAKI